MQNQPPYTQQPNQQFDPSFQMPRKSNTMNTVLIVVGICFGVLLLLGGIAVALLLPAISAARQAARQSMMRNSMKQVSIGVITYRDVKKVFPAAVMLGPDGKTPHSWRVAILPYVGHQDLYNMYRLNEPWDSPTNIKLLPLIPQEYRDLRSVDNSGNTNVAVITGPNFAFNSKPASKGTVIKAVSDGLSNTVMLVETNAPIPWTKPDDLAWDKMQVNNLGLAESDKVMIALMDGSITTFPKEMPLTELHKAMTINGGEQGTPSDWQR